MAIERCHMAEHRCSGIEGLGGQRGFPFGAAWAALSAGKGGSWASTAPRRTAARAPYTVCRGTTHPVSVRPSRRAPAQRPQPPEGGGVVPFQCEGRWGGPSALVWAIG